MVRSLSSTRASEAVAPLASGPTCYIQGAGVGRRRTPGWRGEVRGGRAGLCRWLLCCAGLGAGSETETDWVMRALLLRF